MSDQDQLAVPVTRRDLLAMLAALAENGDDAAARTWEKLTVEWRQEARRVS